MLYSTATAAEWLNLSVATVKYHLYVARDLKPDYILAGRLIFTEGTLQQFKANKRGPGRPSETKKL